MIHEPSHMAVLYRKLERTKQLEERDGEHSQMGQRTTSTSSSLPSLPWSD